MYIPFEQLPPHSRLWIYQADRPLSAEEEKIISASLKDFCSQWEAHRAPLATSFTIQHAQFIILAVDESAAGASGCSIDGSVRALKELGSQLKVDFFDRSKVAFLVDGKVQTCPLNQLSLLFESGTLKPSTPTFDHLVATKSQWESGWKTTAEKSWLVKYLPNNTLSV